MITHMEQTAEKKQARRKRVGELVVTARKQMGMSANQARQAADISRGAWDNVEKGAGAQELSYFAAERLFGWEIGSIQRYIDNGEPEPGPAPATSVITDTPTERDLIDSVHRFETPEARRQAKAILDALWSSLRDGTDTK